MDLRQLKYFIAVAEERNFTRASARLHVSQPPITRQIQMLEEELAVTLFERTHWGVQLTQAGEVLLSNAYGIRALVDYAWDRTRRVGKGAAGRLDVGVFGSGMLSVVPEILRRYSAAHPDVEVMLLNAPQDAQLQALRQNRLLITFDRFLPDDSDLVVEVVARERQVVALHATSPLAAHSLIPIELLHDQPIVHGRDARHADRTAELCRANGFEPRFGQKAADVVSGLVMVAGGFGVCIVPESVQVLQLPGLVYRPLAMKADTCASIELHCAYRQGDASPLLKGLLDVVRAYRHERELRAPAALG
jgi:LysR family transcriptional regulator, benzoate and cis,cis-muconate-responsive activator of ben and cat genes